MINRNGAVSLEDDEDDEELQWESYTANEPPQPAPVVEVPKELSKLEATMQENELLRGQVRVLVKRIADLEQTVATLQAALAQKEKEGTAPKPLEIPTSHSFTMLDMNDVKSMKSDSSSPTTEPDSESDSGVIVNVKHADSKPSVNPPTPSKVSLASAKASLMSLEEEEEDGGWT